MIDRFQGKASLSKSLCRGVFMSKGNRLRYKPTSGPVVGQISSGALPAAILRSDDFNSAQIRPEIPGEIPTIPTTKVLSGARSQLFNLICGFHISLTKWSL